MFEENFFTTFLILNVIPVSKSCLFNPFVKLISDGGDLFKDLKVIPH
jgi:hypothetical protein